MLVSAKLSHLRIAPRKVRLVADIIRGKSLEEAQTILNFTVKKAGLPMLKLLRSAAANAKNNFRLEESGLYIKEIFVDEGRKLKRWRPRARGQAYEIQKKTSHITIVLAEIEGKAKKRARIEKVKRVEKAEKVEKVEGVEKVEEGEVKKMTPIQKPKMRIEAEKQKPKMGRVLGRIFRRKAF